MLSPDYNHASPTTVLNVAFLGGQLFTVKVYDCLFNHIIKGHVLEVCLDNNPNENFIIHLVENGVGLLSCYMSYSKPKSSIGGKGLAKEVLVWACKYFDKNIYSSSLKESKFRFYESENRVPNATKMWKELFFERIRESSFQVQKKHDYYVLMCSNVSPHVKKNGPIYPF